MEKETLRPQFDGKKRLWRIAKKTNTGCGGWRSFGSGAVYASREAAEKKIERLVESAPDMYQKE